MKRGDISSGQDWVLKWTDLVSLMPHNALAKSAVTKLCNLYQHDVKCLTYTEIVKNKKIMAQNTNILSPLCNASLAKLLAALLWSHMLSRCFKNPHKEQCASAH